MLKYNIIFPQCESGVGGGGGLLFGQHSFGDHSLMQWPQLPW